MRESSKLNGAWLIEPRRVAISSLDNSHRFPQRRMGTHALAGATRLFRVAIFIPLLGLLLSGCGINTIPTYEEQAKAKWSDVQNQYLRRADLIPNLVETVKGYAQQERSVLEAVTNARRGQRRFR